MRSPVFVVYNLVASCMGVYFYNFLIRNTEDSIRRINHEFTWKYRSRQKTFCLVI